MLQEKNDFVSWKIGGGRTLGPAPFFVVGIVNCTPDSFYDGGQSATYEAAVQRALDLLDQGAQIIDLGGESTRPFAEPVSAEQEIQRVLPVVQEILRQRPQAVLSIDTVKAQVARLCLQAGALIINDVSALNADPALLDVLLEYEPGYVLMHSQGNPRTMQLKPSYTHVVQEVQDFFAQHLDFLVAQGLAKDKIVLDPGIGFGKLLTHNMQILRNIEQFFVWDCPLFLGLSNKSLWQDFLGRQGSERNAATLAATTMLFHRGVRIHRVHEVRATCDALKVAQALGQGEA